MKMKKTKQEIIYINAAFCPLEEAKISIDDRGFLYGDGLFTSMRVFNGKAFLLDRHLKRLKEQCLQLHIIPPDLDQDLLLELIERNNAFDGLWKMKIIITGGLGRKLDLASRKSGSVVATLRPCEEDKKLVRLALYPKPIDRPVSPLKTLSYLDRLFIKQDVLERGYDDGIGTLRDGTLLEASSSNLFWKVNKELYTPHPALPLLSGLGLDYVIENMQKEGFRVEYVQSTLAGIPKEACVYLVNSVRGVSAVSEVEGRKFERDKEFELLVNKLF